jgi:protein SCO1/2
MEPVKLWGAILIAAFLSSALIVVGAIRSRAPSASSAEAFTGAPKTLEPLFPAPAFTFPGHRGQPVSDQTLRGAPYVANFIFTTCRTVCPLLTSKMVQAQHALTGANLRFVSFSVDPAHDTPEALAAYAKQWNPDESRWDLLSTGEKTLPVVAAGFHITAQANPAPNATDAIIHSAVFVLVDAQGQVRGIYDSEERANFDALLRDARSLANAPAGARVLAVTGKSGEVLYHELSCVACHERPELAPPLRGLLGKQREMEASNLVTIDRAYLRESIIAPDVKRVRGYPLKMPSYDGLLAEEDLTTLVEWVALRPPDAAPAADDAPVELDPVCHMKVRTGPTALHVDHDGHPYWFCSELCRDRFVKAPASFLK